ncbi:holin [Vibrio phage 159E36-2a]
MKLVDNWKQCWKMTSFQLAMIVIVLEWGTNLVNGIPDNPQAWTQSIVVLILPIARLWKQTSVSGS